MTGVLLDDVTIFIYDTYHQSDPIIYPVVEVPIGRPLNWPEEMPECEIEELFSRTAVDGTRILCVNDVLQDSLGRQLRIIDVLGSGTFSHVFKCQILGDRVEFVALKVLKSLDQYRQTGFVELDVHRQLANGPDHPGKNHVMLSSSSFELEGHICIVMPLLHRSLFEGISQNQPTLNLLQAIRNIMRHVSLALEYMHGLGICHCDLKPDNLVFSDQDMDHLLVIDFGSATNSHDGIDYVQSRFYRSPEVIFGLPFGCAVDMWSAGCIAAEMYLDFAILACDTEFEVVMSMVALLGQFPDEMLTRSMRWQRFFDMTATGFQPKMNPTQTLLTTHRYNTVYERIGTRPLPQLILSHHPIRTDEERMLVNSFTDFIVRLLTYDPSKRLTATQALAHPFLQGVPMPATWEPPRASHASRPLPVRAPPASGSLNAAAIADFMANM